MLNSTLNLGQPAAAKGCLGSPLLRRGPPRGHLAAKGYPEFVVEFNNYSINADDDPMSLTSLLHGVPQ